MAEHKEASHTVAQVRAKPFNISTQGSGLIGASVKNNDWRQAAEQEGIKVPFEAKDGPIDKTISAALTDGDPVFRLAEEFLSGRASSELGSSQV